MKPPATPSNEYFRLAELHSLGILDTPPDRDLNLVVELARLLTGKSTALISLVDADRQWFKSCAGLNCNLTETSREISFCGHAILQRNPLIVQNALEDDRFSDNPLVVDDPKVRFYAGIPLISSSGYALGTLCVIDSMPGELTDDQIDTLGRLAHLAMGVIERSHALVSLSKDGIVDPSVMLPRFGSSDFLNLNSLLTRDQIIALTAGAIASEAGVIFSLLRICLRDYQRVSAVYGAVSSERLMDEAARRIVIALGPNASIARFSDSDFLALIPGECDSDSLASLCSRCISLCDEPFVIESRRFACSISIGIAIGNGSYSRVESIVADADMALRLAQKQVASCFRFIDPEARSLAVRSFEMEEQLRQALRDEKLCPSYQPIFHLETGELVGFEVLARWLLGEELLEPSRFIPVSDELHLTGEVDLQVIKKALNEVHLIARAAPWRACYLSVNISATLVEDRDLRAKLLSLVRDYELPPRWRLQVEILEESIGLGELGFDVFISDLAALGVDLLIDDFGTGYSSLSRLVSLPVRSFKVDRSFLAGIDSGQQKSEILLAGVSALADRLGLSTIIEGIETRKQLDWLHHHGFVFGQGFLFARPMLLAACIDYVESLPQRSTAKRKLPPERRQSLARRCRSWLRSLTAAK